MARFADFNKTFFKVSYTICWLGRCVVVLVQNYAIVRVRFYGLYSLSCGCVFCYFLQSFKERELQLLLYPEMRELICLLLLLSL